MALIAVARWPRMNSVKRSIQNQRMRDESKVESRKSKVLSRTDFGFDVTAEVADGKEVAEFADLRVGLELREINEGHPPLQLADSGGRHFAFLNEVGIGQNVLGRQLLAGNLDAEGLFE